jgi:hypothetical protein
VVKKLSTLVQSSTNKKKVVSQLLNTVGIVLHGELKSDFYSLLKQDTLSLSPTRDQPEKWVGRAGRKGSVTTDGILTTASPAYMIFTRACGELCSTLAQALDESI